MQDISPKDINLDLFSSLRQFSFFNSISDDALKQVVTHAQCVQLDSRDIIINQGESAKDVYFILCGKLRVYVKNSDNEEVFFANLKQGDTIGEMAALSGEKRAAFVQATRVCVVIRISNVDFLKLLNSSSQLSLELSKLLVEKLKTANERASMSRSPRPTMQCIGVVPSDQTDTAHDFIKRFEPILNQYKSVYRVTAEIIQEKGFDLTRDGTFSLEERVRLAFYLTDLERQYDCVLFYTGLKQGAWATFVLNNVDSLLCVANAESESELSVVERFILKNETRYQYLDRYLVLVHPSINAVPHDTEQWLVKRQIYSSHHITYDLPKSLRSLARIMTGCCVNLVLSGGGARGYVHIGVLKALRELGVEVDTVSGVSMGSIIGAMIAMEKGPDEIAADCLSLFAGNPLQSLSLIQLPLTSMVKPKSYRKLFYKVYRDLKIEDLWKKYFCLTVNMTKAKEHVFNTGSLVEAVMGSAGLPIMASPLISRGDMHVDGCVLNTMPVDIAKQLYGGEVICVQIAKDSTYPCDKEDDIFPSSWQIFCRMLNPFKKNYDVPMLSEIMTKTIQMANYKKTIDMANLADVVIAPDISSVKPNDHPKVKEIAELGYKEAKIQIEKWLAKKKAEDKQ